MKRSNRRHPSDFKTLEEFAAYMRATPTGPERRLEKVLLSIPITARKQLIYETQVVMSGYVVDLLIPSINLALEADGPDHLNTQERDRQREKVLARQGVETLRFDWIELQSRPMLVRQRIVDVLARRTGVPVSEIGGPALPDWFFDGISIDDNERIRAKERLLCQIQGVPYPHGCGACVAILVTATLGLVLILIQL